MPRCMPVLLVLAFAGPVLAHGLLIPVDRNLPPLAMLDHQVTITIEDQVAITKVVQTFRNHTDRDLEATYVFPVPRGAAVRNFSMTVGGKEVAGEMVEADKAQQVYTDIVRRTQDPGLLEYLGNNLMRLRVFPVPARGDQKVALSFTSVANRDGAVVEYVYPLKTDGKATSTLRRFSIQAKLLSQHPIVNVYSPSHTLSLKRPSDREALVTFERDQAPLDRDFQLFYAVGDKDVGVTALTHRPAGSDNGYFLLLISPRVELPKDRMVPRDMVLVLDTSGSMRGAKLEQAKKAVKYCLDNLGKKDRFGLIHFATTVNHYKRDLVEPSREQIVEASKWVDGLEVSGSTAINDALAAALDMRAADPGRSFTVVFFTDGQPTIGETNPEAILKNVAARNTANTRIFTFGVGDDVNAMLLDQLAEQTRAISTYVRPAEDIETKVSSLYGKISHPVLADLKLSTGKNVNLVEVYPPQLPDLFHGGQLVVLGRYSGHGHAAVTLAGTVGKERRQYDFETSFPAKMDQGNSFVEHLWGRRKVGYLLDQIRAHGEHKEGVDEVVFLAKKYGIATPYTSYLVVPDGPTPAARSGSGMGGGAFAGGMGGGGMGMSGGGMSFSGGGGGFGGGIGGGSMMGMGGGMMGMSGGMMGMGGGFRGGMGFGGGGFGGGMGGGSMPGMSGGMMGMGGGFGARVNRIQQAAVAKRDVLRQARDALAAKQHERVQTGKLGVDLAELTNQLRGQSHLEKTAQKQIAGRSMLEVAGIWMDEGFDAKMPTIAVKAMSDAYFRLLERQPQLKELFQVGNRIVWVTPSGTVLVIEAGAGKEKLSDEQIDKLFLKK